MNDHGPDCICATCDPIWAEEIIRYNLGQQVAA